MVSKQNTDNKRIGHKYYAILGQLFSFCTVKTLFNLSTARSTLLYLLCLSCLMCGLYFDSPYGHDKVQDKS